MKFPIEKLNNTTFNIRWLFRKPEIYFGKKPTGKEIIQIVKNKDLYGLRDILPRNIGGRRFSRKQSLGVILGSSMIGIVLSILTGNPLPFLFLLSIAYGLGYIFCEAPCANKKVVALDLTHFVICFRDGENSSYGTAIVGTISGDEISWGLKYVFNENTLYQVGVCKIDSTHFIVGYDKEVSGYFSACKVGVISGGDEITFGDEYRFGTEERAPSLSISLLDSTHFVLVYEDEAPGDYGVARIGTITDTTVISYGSKYTFNAGVTEKFRVCSLDSTHFAIAFKDVSNNYYITSIIGVVSGGNVIAFGNKCVVENVGPYTPEPVKIDSTHFIVIYGSDGNGTAVIGTVASEDEITFGDKYNFHTGGCYHLSCSLLDSTHFVVIYSYSISGSAVVGTISGVDEISYGSEYEFNDAYSYYNSVSTLDSTHFVFVYMDAGNSNYGTAIIGTYTPAGVGYTSPLPVFRRP